MSRSQVRVLAVGDHFIPAAAYATALGELLPEAEVRTVQWAGTKGEQHAEQQVMEWRGPEAVRVPAEVLAAVGDVDVLAVHFAPVPQAVFAAAPRLRAVVVARAGVENVDVSAATGRGVAVVNVAGRNASAVAELALGLMLAEARSIARAHADIAAGGWRKEFAHPGQEVGGSTVGMVGFGHVGRELAARLAGFAARLLVADPYVGDAQLGRYGARRVDLDTVFREADFVHVQARLTPETERFIGRAQLALMKPSAYFVNTARSRLVDYQALYEALAERRIAGAALDVYDEEPLPPDSPWRRLDNVTLTPHYGGDTVTTNERSARLVAEAVVELAGSGRCRAAVNAADLGWA